MKEQLPPPEFNTGQYLRASQRWVCGRAKDGRACHIGPTASGLCRATTECSPLMETKEGETKGRYRCTRLKEFGGPCEPGPLPDGACSQRIPRCQPVRSLRIKRGYFTSSIIGLTVGGLLMALYGPFRWSFISPGKVSSHHTGASFARLQTASLGDDRGCAACHKAGNAGPAGWLETAFNARPGPFQFRDLYYTSKTEMTVIDKACERCHSQHNFHEPNVVQEMSCSLCHREHTGSGPMPQPDNANCASCHGDPGVMEASFQLSKTLRPEVFDYRKPKGGVEFKAPRPERGFTKVFQSFVDHPEFQVLAEKLQDPDTLRFNHRRHLSGEIPLLNGKKLDCADCHKPDTAGTYHLKISYNLNCRPCHALQFDSRNPDLVLPHGSPAAVRAFLRSLPTQYADLAARTKGITGKRDLDEFVTEQMRQIREQHGSGESLEQQVFFANNRWGPVVGGGGPGNQGRALFIGCAYCHLVTPMAESVPAVTAPVISDRWLLRGQFDHSKHVNLTCTKCHDVDSSDRTADISLPSKRVCADCHRPQGGAAHSCATCHKYHTSDRIVFPTQAAQAK